MFNSVLGRFVTRITYLGKCIGISLLATFLQLEIYWVYRYYFDFYGFLFFSKGTGMEYPCASRGD
ncbi:hypothetical protein CWC46_00010 [Prodigiosinella confusarubida]|uniref:Uncharacterized protein n=1 Tax=Serratia sp. (strain ATCC 39006) TaxID=104623 RepID=A0A2I5T1B8_SERS3|nr:hypothetical protein CWC46_00010 [Serratia sp. ATCC 39006]AUH02660.1 hypothetical protein Ser39006_000010 [Serratia sp. ATCC 39006]